MAEFAYYTWKYSLITFSVVLMPGVDSEPYNCQQTG